MVGGCREPCLPLKAQEAGRPPQLLPPIWEHV